MGEWTLLGHGSDPVVADTAVIDDRVAHYRKLADEMQVNAERLDRIADGTALAGRYADELRSSSGEVARDLHKVVGRYQAVAGALEAYEPEVQHALAESQGALDDAVAANGSAQAAADMSTEQAAEGATLTPEQTAHNDEKTARTNQAADALAAAKGRLNRALDALDGAGRAAAGTIRQGFGDGLKDSGWDRFVHGFMKFLKILVKVLTYIAMALAVIALVIPGLGEIILAAGAALAAVTVVAEGALVAGGEGSWADFGIAIAGLLTFGVGKLFGPAIQAGLKSIGTSVKSSVSGAMTSARDSLAGFRGPRPALAGVGDDAASAAGSGRSSFDAGSRSAGTGTRTSAPDDLPSAPTHEPRSIGPDDFPSAPTHEPRSVGSDDFPSAPTHEPRSVGSDDFPSAPTHEPSAPGTPARAASPEPVSKELEDAMEFLPLALKRQGDSAVFKLKGEGDALRFRGEDPETMEGMFTVERTGEDVRFDVDTQKFLKPDGSPADFTKIDVPRPADGYLVRNFEGQDLPKAETLEDLARIGDNTRPTLVRTDQLGMTVREDLDPRRVEEIRQALESNTPLPPVGLSRGVPPTINDGNHRIQAARELGLEYLPVTIS